MSQESDTPVPAKKPAPPRNVIQPYTFNLRHDARWIGLEEWPLPEAESPEPSPGKVVPISKARELRKHK